MIKTLQLIFLLFIKRKPSPAFSIIIEHNAKRGLQPIYAFPTPNNRGQGGTRNAPDRVLTEKYITFRRKKNYHIQ